MPLMPSHQNLFLESYANIHEFLTATETFLHEEEIKNTFILTMSYQMRDNNSIKKAYYCGAVWKTNTTTNNHQLVFAILAKDEDYLYASSLLNDSQPEAVLLLLEHLHNTSTVSVQGIHAYQPVLHFVKNAIERLQQRHFKLKLSVWSYQLTKDCIHWSKRAKAIASKDTVELRLATDKDSPLIKLWTSAFFSDAFHENDTDPTTIDNMCKCMIGLKEVYLLCVDGTPVTMAWQLRPLKYGCSLGYVYTPPKHRHQGYGEACVTMMSEALLETFNFITLFVDKNQDKDDNLYTRIGYRYYGEAGRFTRADK